jgi:predicted nucleic acid-binding protein
VAVAVFLDTSVLVAGLIDFGVQSAPAQSLLHAVSERTVRESGTAWHCCLEFYSVATRLPAEYRLAPADAVRLIEEEIFGRMAVHDLPPAQRRDLLSAASRDGIAGGRVYDAHIAEIARVIVTDNRRHFLAALRHGLRVETPGEFMAALKRSR